MTDLRKLARGKPCLSVLTSSLAECVAEVMRCVDSNGQASVAEIGVEAGQQTQVSAEEAAKFRQFKEFFKSL